MLSKFQEIEHKWVKFKVFLTHPRILVKVAQSVSQKNRPHCAKANWGLSFPGQFPLKPRTSQVSLGSRQLANVAQVPRNRAQLGQDQSFPNPPSAPFLSVTVSKSEKPATLRQSKFGVLFPWAISSNTKAVTS